MIDEATPDKTPKFLRWRTAHEESVMQNESIASCFILRCGLGFGRAGSLLSVFIGQALGEDGTMYYPGDGANHLPMVHVDDIARAVLLAGESTLIGPNMFVVSADNVMVAELLHEMASSLGLDTEDAVVYTGRPKRTDLFGRCMVMEQKADASFTRLRLNWAPRHRPFCDDASRYVDAMQAFFATNNA